MQASEQGNKTAQILRAVNGVCNVGNEWSAQQEIYKLFITCKTGPGLPMGYNDKLNWI